MSKGFPKEWYGSVYTRLVNDSSKLRSRPDRPGAKQMSKIRGNIMARAGYATAVGSGASCRQL